MHVYFTCSKSFLFFFVIKSNEFYRHHSGIQGLFKDKFCYFYTKYMLGELKTWLKMNIVIISYFQYLIDTYGVLNITPVKRLSSPEEYWVQLFKASLA